MQTPHHSTPIGQLFMVIAPSGAGKSSLVNALLAQDASLRLSISYTTRPARPGEIDGQAYHFVTAADFQRRKAAGEFLESAEVHGNYYATSRHQIETYTNLGHDVLLEIDWQGARQVRQQFPAALSIFILPPSIEALEARLHSRGQDSLQVINRRLLAAGGEIAHAPESEYVIINQDFAVALDELASILKAARLRYPSQAKRHAELFMQLGLH